ncbi:MAG: D-glycero-beta-D-manno-heptose 1,7-bisphosphate 7-phosphatase [Calditrichaeota bacterium]|nr:MAG: D-glycero-beta-D-manno-heptose 1,7-bisphosphate 7-phosphatase [Calditrichota bacterium]
MINKALIIRFSSLGDIILTSSLALNYKINHPDSKIYFLTKEKFKKTVSLIDAVDEIVTIPDDCSFVNLCKIGMELDKINFNTVIDLHGNFRSLTIRKILTADHKVVYPKRRYERITAVKKKIIPESYPHTIDLYNQTLIDLEMNSYSKRPNLVSTNNISDTEKSFLSKHPHTVLFAPGASYATKQYDIQKFAQAAETLQREYNAGIIWAVTNESEIVSELSQIPESSLMKYVNLPITELTSLIAKTDLVIANDSGIGHLASSVNTPVVSLFGPTHPVLGFSPKGQFDQVLDVKEYCRPCSLHGGKACFREEQFCFTKISPEQIVNLASYKLEHQNCRNKAVFVDRDGTIIVDKHFLSDPNEIEFIEGSVDALKRLSESGYKIVVVSNQSGVARGKFPIETVEKVNQEFSEKLSARGVDLDAIYYCPHHPHGSVNQYTIKCGCRKPSPLMVEDAIEQLLINPIESFVIGDKLDDINLGKVVGAKPILVRTGYGRGFQEKIDSSRFYHDVKIVDNLAAAAEFIGDHHLD